MLALATTTAATVLADKNMPLNNDTVTPGFLGFGVFVALGVVLVFLVRSMNKRMKGIQAPKEADLKQQDWERAEAAKAEAELEAKAEAKLEVKASSAEAKAPADSES
ncbi:hypothetical protein [Actinomadura harenae]|uniref:hypothetical protein n=1 Tax=Actinomadura harenae TaxID=2483351 RepID=UPI0018F46F0D|nr:hypothetical protein [Actinomadura harenae]